MDYNFLKIIMKDLTPFFQSSQELGPQNKGTKNYLTPLMIADLSGEICLRSTIFDSNLLCGT